MVTPATRCRASVTLRSGRAPMSVAVIESTSCSAFCFSFCADWIAARWPVTTTSSTVSAAWAWATAGATAQRTSAEAPMNIRLRCDELRRDIAVSFPQMRSVPAL